MEKWFLLQVLEKLTFYRSMGRSGSEIIWLLYSTFQTWNITFFQCLQRWIRVWSLSRIIKFVNCAGVVLQLQWETVLTISTRWTSNLISHTPEMSIQYKHKRTLATMNLWEFGTSVSRTKTFHMFAKYWRSGILKRNQWGTGIAMDVLKEKWAGSLFQPVVRSRRNPVISFMPISVGQWNINQSRYFLLLKDLCGRNYVEIRHQTWDKHGLHTGAKRGDWKRK